MKYSSMVKLCSTVPVLMLAGGLAWAMPGMDEAEVSGTVAPPAASKSMGAPLNLLASGHN